MVVEMKIWLICLIVGLLIAFGFLAGNRALANIELRNEKAAAEKNEAKAIQELNQYKQNKGFLVKEDATRFLKAYLETDKRGLNTEKRIYQYTTKKARAEIAPPGEKDADPDDPVKIISKLTDMKLYHTDIRSDRAGIYAKVTREIRVNDIDPSTTEHLFELQLVLIGGKWIVDDVKLIEEY